MSETIGHLRVPLYLVALVFVVTPVIDIIANVMPLHLGTMQWRFGATGVASNYLISIVFGSALAALVAVSGGKRTTLRVIGALGLLAVFGLLIASGFLVLDTLQLRREVPPEALRNFQVGAWKTLFKLLSTALALAAIARALLRTTPAHSVRSEDPSFLIHKKA